MFVSLGIAARKLSVSRATMLVYVKQGRFPRAFEPPTGIWRVPLADVEAMRDAGIVGTANG